MELRVSDRGVPPSVYVVSPRTRQRKATRCHRCAYVTRRGRAEDSGSARTRTAPGRSSSAISSLCAGYRPLEGSATLA